MQEEDSLFYIDSFFVTINLIHVIIFCAFKGPNP